MSRVETRKCPREDCPDLGHKKIKEKVQKLQNIFFTNVKVPPPICVLRKATKVDLPPEGLVMPPLSLKEMESYQHSDPDIKRFINLLVTNENKPFSKELTAESNEVRIYCSMWDHFILLDNILYKRQKPKQVSTNDRLVLPKVCRTEIMRSMHDSKFAGHPGMTRMKASLTRKFYWPRMTYDIESWVKCCQVCELSKRGPNKRKSPLIQDISGVPFQRVAFDIIGPLQTTQQGNRYILVMVDYYTKWSEAYAISDRRAETVANAIMGEWIARHGVPLRLHCDNAQEFRSNVLKEIRELLNIRGTFITPYRPKGNGLCERTNGTIETILKCMIREQRHEWDIALPYALMAYRSTPHSSTNLSPNMMVYGRESTMPCDIMYGNMTNKIPRSHACYCAYVDDLRSKMVNSYKIASDCLKTTAIRQKRIHDSNTVPRQFNEGDWVLFYHRRLANQTLTSGWTGPHVVVKKIGDSTYKIQSKPEGPTKVVNVDNLMPHVTREIVPNWIIDRKIDKPDENRIANQQKEMRTQVSRNKQHLAVKRKEIPGAIQPPRGPTARSVRRSSRLASKDKVKYVCLYFSMPIEPSKETFSKSH
jgi:hypothetical protein